MESRSKLGSRTPEALEFLVAAINQDMPELMHGDSKEKRIPCLCRCF